MNTLKVPAVIFSFASNIEQWYFLTKIRDLWLTSIRSLSRITSVDPFDVPILFLCWDLPEAPQNQRFVGLSRWVSSSLERFWLIDVDPLFSADRAVPGSSLEYQREIRNYRIRGCSTFSRPDTEKRDNRARLQRVKRGPGRLELSLRSRNTCTGRLIHPRTRNA